MINYKAKRDEILEWTVYRAKENPEIVAKAIDTLVMTVLEEITGDDEPETFKNSGVEWPIKPAPYRNNMRTKVRTYLKEIMENKMQDYIQVTGFHSHNNLFFRREKDGSVTVEKWTEEQPFKIQSSTTLDPNTWASVVASVSTRGETSETFHEALDGHLKS